jgi:uncharacterized protein (TIGR02246 family)
VDELARLVVESAIRRTLAEYCHACDDGRFADYAHCFTPDAEVVIGDDVVARGRDQIEAWITARQPPESRGRHVVANTLVLWRDAQTAHAVSDFVFLAGPSVAAQGRYLDDFVPDGARWLIVRREIRLA